MARKLRVQYLGVIYHVMNRGYHREPIFCEDAVHWDHEPTRYPSQEWNWHDADERLLRSWECSEAGRFLESRTVL